jgi:hypothetical protein
MRIRSDSRRKVTNWTKTKTQVVRPWYAPYSQSRSRLLDPQLVEKDVPLRMMLVVAHPR